MAKKVQQRKLLNVEIIYEDAEDLQQLEDSPQFNDLILKDAFDVVERAAKTKKKSVPLVAIPKIAADHAPMPIERHAGYNHILSNICRQRRAMTSASLQPLPSSKANDLARSAASGSYAEAVHSFRAHVTQPVVKHQLAQHKC